MTAITRDVLPDLNAVLIKELRQELRVKSFEHSFMWFHVAMLVLTAFSPTGGPSSSAGSWEGWFWGIISIPLLLVIPIRAFSAFSKETKANELELIFLTRVSAWQMVFYKWAALCLEGFLLLTAALPYAIVRYFLGSMNILEALQMLGFFLLLMMLLSALAVLASAWSGRKGRVPFLVVVLGVLFGVPTINVFVAFSYTLFRGSSHIGTLEAAILAIVYTPLLLLLLLEFGAAHIAPAAENHAIVKRLLGLLALAVTGVFLFFDFNQGVLAATVLCIMTPVCIGGLTESTVHIQSIYAPFVRGGTFRRVAGLFVYPGWPSAVLYTHIILFILALFALQTGKDANLIAKSAAAIGAALMFPLVVANICLPKHRSKLFFYVLFQILLLSISFLILQFADRHSCTNPTLIGTVDQTCDFLISLFPLSAVTFSIESRSFCVVEGATLLSSLIIYLMLAVQVASAFVRLQTTIRKTKEALALREAYE